MAETDTIQPGGEKLRKAIRWVSETSQTNPEKSRPQLIKEAEIRFDLSPKECCFLDDNFQNE